jgi:hypothetical protein
MPVDEHSMEKRLVVGDDMVVRVLETYESHFALCGKSVEEGHEQLDTSHLQAVGEDVIDAARSPRGGWTKAQLAEWGVPWPPPKGWRRALIAGELPVVVVDEDPSWHVRELEPELAVWAC